MKSVYYAFPRRSHWVRDSTVGFRDRERRQDKVLLGANRRLSHLCEGCRTFFAHVHDRLTELADRMRVARGR